MQHQYNFLQLVEQYRPYVKENTVPDVIAKLKGNNDFILIDVREDHEWQQGHIPTAIHMGRGIIERDIEKSIAKDAEIVLYCGGGFRSILVAYNLQKMGYTNVTSMDGGVSGWLNANQHLVV